MCVCVVIILCRRSPENQICSQLHSHSSEAHVKYFLFPEGKNVRKEKKELEKGEINDNISVFFIRLKKSLFFLTNSTLA